MKYINNKFALFISVGVALLACFIFLTSLTLPPANNDSLKEKIKSRFPSMTLDKGSIEKMMNIPGFDRFIFQQFSSDKSGLTGGRKIYTLIVYPADSKGNVIGDSIELERLKGRKKEVFMDYNDDVKLANYHLTKKQYETLVKSGTERKPLQFDPSMTGPDPNPRKRYFNGYVTYIVTVASNSGVQMSSNKDLEDENFLKPSPPAPPDL